jgi:hypothetical protein
MDVAMQAKVHLVKSITVAVPMPTQEHWDDIQLIFGGLEHLDESGECSLFSWEDEIACANLEQDPEEWEQYEGEAMVEYDPVSKEIIWEDEV